MWIEVDLGRTHGQRRYRYCSDVSLGDVQSEYRSIQITLFPDTAFEWGLEIWSIGCGEIVHGKPATELVCFVCCGR